MAKGPQRQGCTGSFSHNVVLSPLISAHYSFPLILAGLFPLQFVEGRLYLHMITLSISSALG